MGMTCNVQTARRRISSNVTPRMLLKSNYTEKERE